MKAYDVEIERTVKDTVPVWSDTPQQAIAEVELSLKSDETVEVVGVSLNEFWTDAFSSEWPPYDSEGCYLDRD